MHTNWTVHLDDDRSITGRIAADNGEDCDILIWFADDGWRAEVSAVFGAPDGGSTHYGPIGETYPGEDAAMDAVVRALRPSDPWHTHGRIYERAAA